MATTEILVFCLITDLIKFVHEMSSDKRQVVSESFIKALILKPVMYKF
jgi:hypothetical protein